MPYLPLPKLPPALSSPVWLREPQSRNPRHWGFMCWNQEVQGLPQMRRRHARASLAPCAGAWTPHSPSIACVGLFPYLVHIFYLSSTAEETSLSVAKRHRQAIAKCLAGAKHICPPVCPYPLSFDLMHGPYAPAVVSGGKCLYSPNYPHASAKRNTSYSTYSILFLT